MQGVKSTSNFKYILNSLTYIVGFLNNFEFRLSQNLTSYFNGLNQEILKMHRHYVDEISKMFLHVSNDNHHKYVDDLKLMDDKFNNNLKIVEKHLENFNENLYNLNKKVDYIMEFLKYMKIEQSHQKKKKN